MIRWDCEEASSKNVICAFSCFFGPLKGLRVWGEEGRYFLYIFSGFAIDRSKKYIKTTKIDRKIDAVDLQAAADNRPPPPGHNG